VAVEWPYGTAVPSHNVAPFFPSTSSIGEN
jgi:hypothetical protein